MPSACSMCVLTGIIVHFESWPFPDFFFLQICDPFKPFSRHNGRGGGGQSAAWSVPTKSNTIYKDTYTRPCLEWDSHS